MADEYDAVVEELYPRLDGHTSAAEQKAMLVAALRAAADAARAGQRRRDAAELRSRAALRLRLAADSPDPNMALADRLKAAELENAADALERGAGRPEGA